MGAGQVRHGAARRGDLIGDGARVEGVEQAEIETVSAWSSTEKRRR